MPVAFFECPDVFPLGDARTTVAIASFYNWHKGAYFTNEWFVGAIDPSESATFQTHSRGLLDYGQLYAARTGASGDGPAGRQAPNGRRVLFGATGWHNPPGMDSSCDPQIHLIPRDLGIDKVTGGLSIAPIPELATLRVGAATVGDEKAGAVSITTGARLQLQLNCTGSFETSGGDSDVVGFEVLATSDRMAFTRVGYNLTSRRMFVDHRSSSRTVTSEIVQTTAAGLVVQPKETSLVLDVLVDGALLEVFGNRRAVISSFVTELMREGTNVTAPADRATFLVAPASGNGMACKWRAHQMKGLA